MAVTNKQMMMNAKVRTMQRHGVDLTTANIVLIGAVADSDIAIQSIRCRIETIMDDDNSVVVGHGVLAAGAVPDPNSLVEAENILDTTAEGAMKTFTLAATLKNANVKEAKGFPIVPQGLPIYATVDGVPTTGVGTFIIDYIPLDVNSY